jgi:iron complex outermembrane recepter protein
MISIAAAQSTGNDTSLAEVIVTATKTGVTDLQKTPLAVTAFSADRLSEYQVLNISDITAITPNLQVSQQDMSADISIRGIGSNNVSAGSDPDVTMQIDGVYIARPSAQYADFLDVERVEVLRGPQGTLYGRNAVGGTINIISRQPTDQFAAQEVLTAGNYGLLQNQAYVSGPLVPGKLQGSVSADYIYHRDYQDNIAPGAQHGLNDGNHGGGRVQLRYEPVDGLDMTTRADWSYLSENVQAANHLLIAYPGDVLGATIIGDNSRVAFNSPQSVIQHTGGVSEDINYSINEHYALRSVTAYRSDTYDFILDTDATPLNINYGSIGESEKELSQELNLNIRYDSFTGVAGAYYLYESEKELNSVTLPGPRLQVQTAPQVWTRSAAAFAQGTYALTADVRLTLGGRYTRETKTLEADYRGYVLDTQLEQQANLPGYPINFATAPTFSAFTPKIGLDWQINPEALLYVSATRGYKSGGENFAATSLETSSFNPEYIWSYEAGVKTEWLDRRLRANLTGFYYDYKNLQVQSALAAGVVVIGNAATATDKGLEAEITAQPTPALQLTSVLSWLDARYSKFTSASVPSALKAYLVGEPRYNAAEGTYDASGNYLDSAPRFSGMVGGQYNWRLSSGDSLFAHADVSYQSRVYFDPSNSLLQSQGGYTLLNASAGYVAPRGGWRFELWGRNLAQKQYYIATSAASLEPAGVAARPRTFGVRISKQW